MARIVAVHGLGGVPESLGELPTRLRAARHTVATPTLTGHGGVSTDLVDVEALAWIGDIDRALGPESPDDRPWLVGQSLGGTLALLIASQRRDIAGVVAVNPPCGPADPDVADHFDWLIERGRTMSTLAPATFVSAPGARDVGYDEVPVTALRALAEVSAMAWAALADIEVPVLLVTSKHDDVVDPSGADDVAARIRGAHRLVLSQSGHVAFLDGEADPLIDAVATWIATHS
jgi:carboxylesterase